MNIGTDDDGDDSVLYCSDIYLRVVAWNCLYWWQRPLAWWLLP